MPTREQGDARIRAWKARQPERQKSEAEEETERRIDDWMDRAFPLASMGEKTRHDHD